MGIGVLGESIYKVVYEPFPSAEIMGLVGVLALIANGISFWLLWYHRSDDINMRSTWVCSRNDIIANCGVLLAGLGVVLTQSFWPDLIIGLIVAGIFLRSATLVIRNALKELSARELNKLS